VDPHEKSNKEKGKVKSRENRIFARSPSPWSRIGEHVRARTVVGLSKLAQRTYRR